MAEELVEDSSTDICRVCRSESTPDKPLFHPCLCRGSIKYVHQDCLTQWLKYSRKEFCELCNHKYTFTPIYHPDMPKRLPVRDFLFGLLSNLARAIQFWLHYTLVALAWLGAVPLSACRIHRALFRGSLSSILSLPFEIFSSENLFSDCFTGMLIMSLSLCAFVSLVWLREQIIHGGPLNWAHNNQNNNNNVNNNNNAREHNNNNVNVNNHNNNDGNRDEALGENVEQDVGAENVAEIVEENQIVENQSLYVSETILLQDEENLADGNPPENAAPEALQDDDQNWQPFEWAPANGEELTWERLLGLDGSLIFLEHVFWVISLNALFLVVFAFLPYHVGNINASLLKIKHYIEATFFDRLVTTLLGYVFVGFSLFILQYASRLLKLRKVQRVFGMSYLVIKVFWLVLMEIGIFPLICGFWLDMCSLMLFSGSFRDRIASFKNSPGTSAFLHWLVGMIYVFYFASFILLLREVLRPGVLWFLRNLNDPEFNPIQEMIQYPVFHHIRRFAASVVMFGVTILIIVYYPIRIILKTCPTVLPYHIHLASLNSTAYLNIETSLSELSLELLLLQVVLPALLEQSHARHALKLLVKGWCMAVTKLLGLQDYLLPFSTSVATEQENQPLNALNANNVENDADNERQEIDDEENRDDEEDNQLALEVAPPPLAPLLEIPPANGNLGAEHQALLLGGRNTSSFQSYSRPKFFVLRIILLLMTLATSGLIGISLGRYTIYLLTGHKQVHELYTLACGLYECWLLVRLAFLCSEYLPWGLWAVVESVKSWAVVICKCVMVAVSLLFFIPLLFGILFQLVLVVPLRVNINQSPLFFPWQDWAMGILHCKIACALIMMGPDWRIKRVFDRIYQDGFRNINVTYIYKELIVPVVVATGLTISLPYVTAYSIAPLLGLGDEEQILLQRHIYPSLLIITSTISFFYWQMKQVRNLLLRIRNE
uniref:RING-type E3 ubiquitin transferase n=1 Tax=Romanomermis culicivorax TaxID=13658 RepID=A0A915KD79_ROMCU